MSSSVVMRSFPSLPRKPQSGPRRELWESLLRAWPESSKETREFYAALLFWVDRCLERTSKAQRPLIIGLSAPQGAGKSTLTHALCQAAPLLGFQAVSLSIDDFYLTRAQQAALAERHSSNPYLQNRGYPGTHDIELGVRTLDALKAIERFQSVRVPSYDKSAYTGLGDRKSPEEWPTVHAPLDVIFLEGWMLGFRPPEESELTHRSDQNLREIDEQLAPYQAWLERLDALIWLEPEKHEFVLDWRVEAEERMKAQGRSGMSLSQIMSYIRLFLPAYGAYLPAMKKSIPVDGAFLHLVIGHDRLPVSETPRISTET